MHYIGLTQAVCMQVLKYQVLHFMLSYITLFLMYKQQSADLAGSIMAKHII